MKHLFLARTCASPIVTMAVWLAPAVAAGQTPDVTRNTTATTTWTAPLTPDGKPDLNGVWVNRTATPLERPEALKGRPFLTDAEVVQLKARADRIFKNANGDAPVGDTLFLAALADVEQYRSPNSTQTVGLDDSVVEREFDNRTSLITDPPDGRIPPLTPEGQRRQAANAARSFNIPWPIGLDPATATAQQQIAAATARLPVPAGPLDLSNPVRCITWGVPRVGGTASYTSHFQIVQTARYVVIVQEVNHDARIIPVDGGPHLPPGIRQWNGDSRGRWEGQTLVVDTTNFSPRSYFMGSAENLHLIERFTRVGADTINYEVTIEDSTTWTRPWTTRIPLRRTEDSIYEFACHEGNYHTIRGILAGARAGDMARPD
jgi:hypothetical protein